MELQSGIESRLHFGEGAGECPPGRIEGLDWLDVNDLNTASVNLDEHASEMTFRLSLELRNPSAARTVIVCGISEHHLAVPPGLAALACGLDRGRCARETFRPPFAPIGIGSYSLPDPELPTLAVRSTRAPAHA